MSIYKTFQTSKDMERDGIWLDYGLLDEDVTKPIRIKVARSGGSNQNFAKALETKTKPHRRSIQTETIDTKIVEKLLMETFVDSVILDWTNVSDKDGNVLPFTRENVILVMTDLPDLFADIREQSAKAVLYRQEILDVDAKN